MSAPVARPGKRAPANRQEARPSEAVVAAWRALLLAHRHLTESLERDLIETRGITLGWYDVLFQLSEAGDGMRMSDLARAVLLSRSGLTRLIDRMAREGLVVRNADPEDGRGIRVELTAKGRQVFRRAVPVHLKGIAEYVGGPCSGDDAVTLRGLLERLCGGESDVRPETSLDHVTPCERS